MSAKLRSLSPAKDVFRLLTIALCAAFGPGAAGQNHSEALAVQVSKDFSEKWTFKVDGLFGQEHSETRSNVIMCGVGAGYHLNNDAVIAVYNKLAYADYMHIDNKDTEISVTESISWRRASGLFFGFYFEQRRLIYKPADYAKNVSSCGGIVGWGKKWEKIGLWGSVGCQVVCNMKTPNTKAEFVQRVKVPISLKKKISEKMHLGLTYTYGALGDNQRYIMDRDRMNALRLTWGINL